VAYRGDRLVAAVIYDNWTPNSVCVHQLLRSPTVLRHGWLQAVCHYGFVVRGINQSFGTLPSNNPRAYKFNQHIGYREVGRMPDYFDDGVDRIIMQMNKDECRYL
jgi:RimJ/RimL family protein N-acetyltransferase